MRIVEISRQFMVGNTLFCVDTQGKAYMTYYSYSVYDDPYTYAGFSSTLRVPEYLTAEELFGKCTGDESSDGAWLVKFIDRRKQLLADIPDTPDYAPIINFYSELIRLAADLQKELESEAE